MLHIRYARMLRILQDAEDRGEQLNYDQVAEQLGVARTSAFKIRVALTRRGFVEMVGRPPHAKMRVVRRIETITKGTPVSDDPMVAFIHRHQLENDGASPNFIQIRDGLDMPSTNRIGAELTRLQKDGALVLHGEKQRVMTMIHVVKRPQDKAAKR